MDPELSYATGDVLLVENFDVDFFYLLLLLKMCAKSNWVITMLSMCMF